MANVDSAPKIANSRFGKIDYNNFLDKWRLIAR